MANPRMLKAAAIHINTNIFVPIDAPMFNPAWLVMTFLKIMNITVAIIVAVTVRRAAMNVQIAIANDHHRDFMTIGVMKIETKVMQTPVKKKPNMR
jgi:hypothetical protein